MSVRAMENVREGNGNYAPPIIVEQEISPWLPTSSHGLIYISVVTLLLWHYKTVEVTTDEVADNKARIEQQDVHNVLPCV